MKKKRAIKALIALVFVLVAVVGAVVSTSAVEVVGQIPAYVGDTLPQSLQAISSDYDMNAPSYSFVIDTYAIYYMLYIDQTDVYEFDYAFENYLVQWTQENQNYIESFDIQFRVDMPQSGELEIMYPRTFQNGDFVYDYIDIVQGTLPEYRYIIVPFSEFGNDFYVSSILTTVRQFHLQFNNTTNTYVGAPLALYNNAQYNSVMQYAEQRYIQGQADATDIGDGGAKLITAVVEAPVNVFTRMLNFEILGVNVLGFVVALLSFGLVFAILKKVL